MSIGLGRQIVEWLEALPNWRDIAPYGGGLSAKLLSRRLLLRRYREAFPEPLAGGEQTRLLQWLEDFRDEIVGDANRVRGVIDRASREAQQRGLSVSAADLATRLVDEVARSRHRGCAPSSMELEALAETYLDNAPALDRLMSRDEFQAFAPYYDEAWSRDGDPNLQNHPYSRVLLGDDKRPPLAHARRENTWDGLARSVYSRYRLAMRDPQVRGNADQIGRTEVKRTCGRLGLMHESGLVVLYSLIMGLYKGPSEQHDGWQPTPYDERGQWRNAPGPVTADDVVPFNNQELVAFAEHMIGKFCVKVYQGQWLRKNGGVFRAHQHAMRRAWMDCFAEERREGHITAERAAQIIQCAVFKGIPSGERHILERGKSTVAEIAGSQANHGIPGAVDAEQVNRACEWFAANPSIGIGIINGDAACVAKYCDDIEAYGLPQLEDIKDIISEGKA